MLIYLIRVNRNGILLIRNGILYCCVEALTLSQFWVGYCTVAWRQPPLDHLSPLLLFKLKPDCELVTRDR